MQLNWSHQYPAAVEALGADKVGCAPMIAGEAGVGATTGPWYREYAGAAFYIKREGEPRISSVEFSGFCIDGLHFIDDGIETNKENTYINQKIGIYVASPQDSFRINGMGMVYLEHGIVIYNADALSIHDNFIAECGNCIELRGWGQASKVTENLIGAGYNGFQRKP